MAEKKKKIKRAYNMPPVFVDVPVFCVAPPNKDGFVCALLAVEVPRENSDGALVTAGVCCG